MRIRVALVHDAIAHALLVDLSIVDLLLQTVVDHQPIDEARLLLPIAVDPTDGLRVVAGIPAGVENDHPIRTDQIDTQRTSAGRHQKQVDVRVRVELVD